MTPSADLARMKILIVDDEPANIALLKYMLETVGYTHLLSTCDARTVSSIHRVFQPDLLLLDLMMPYISGFEILRDLRKEKTGDEMPILVLTADVNTESKHEALQAGASDFLTKPFDQTEVLLRIRHLLQLRLQQRMLAHQNDVLEDAVRERTSELSSTLQRLQETLHQLRSTQQQVIQHERLSALGSMAAGLAHDFNNSLSLILGYSELLRNDLAGSPYSKSSEPFLGTIVSEAQDAAQLFGRLRGIYRQADQSGRQPVDLNELIEQAAAVTRPRWHGQALANGVTISFEMELQPGLPHLMADGPELREMLTNLIFNAVDAMPKGGTITVRTRCEDPAATGGERKAESAPRSIRLEVADTGTGMDLETRSRCLEPFYTTKGQKGTGLGLAMVYGTIQHHGGSIELISAQGEGATFILRFPLVAAEPVGIASPRVDDHHGTLRILVVDDQQAFVNVMRQFLTRDLHYVETAANGAEALQKFDEKVFDLVITDRAMPHMNGEQLAVRVKAIAPYTRIILLTGYDKTGGEDPRTINTTVIKPITQGSLRAAIDRTMAGYVPAPLSKRSKRLKRASEPPGATKP